MRDYCLSLKWGRWSLRVVVSAEEWVKRRDLVTPQKPRSKACEKERSQYPKHCVCPHELLTVSCLHMTKVKPRKEGPRHSEISDRQSMLRLESGHSRGTEGRCCILRNIYLAFDPGSWPRAPRSLGVSWGIRASLVVMRGLWVARHSFRVEAGGQEEQVLIRSLELSAQPSSPPQPLGRWAGRRDEGWVNSWLHLRDHWLYLHKIS